MGIIPIPIIINPVPKTNPMVLKLSIIDCFNMDIPSNSLPSIALKKELRKTNILSIWSALNTLIVIAPIIMPIAKIIERIK